MEKNILFLGLGNMGFPMAGHLVKAGYTVFGSDLDQSAIDKFIQNGGKKADNPQEIVTQCPVVLSSLPTPQIVENIYLGENGLLNKMEKGSCIIDFSTISPALNEKIYEESKKRGVHYLGAPVSGSTKGAIEATLTIMVGGEKAVYDKMLPLLKIMGSNPFHIGDSASIGTQFKLLNNMLLGIYNQAVGEGTALASAMGIDQEKLYSILKLSFGQSRSYDRNYSEFIAKDNYVAGFSVDLLLKDMKLAKEMATQYDVKTPVADRAVEIYSDITKEGNGMKDMAYSYINMKNINQKS